ncbi:MAG: asparaginase [Methylococcales bacterium]|nr:asparaginase [Methylococcales bacterium]MCK5924409.1 asparaginase [Methylococcales bacterium]
MKKIILITTGGTIASVVNSSSISIDVSQQSILTLIAEAKETLKCEIDIKSPLNKNSENFIPYDWVTLLQSLAEIDDDDIEGIVITHGTDTMVYSMASVLCYQSKWQQKICFTGAYYPPEHSDSDASLNLLAAISFVLSPQAQQGLYFAFRADPLNMKANIMEAAAVKPMSFDTRCFESFYGQVIATFQRNSGLSAIKPLSFKKFPCLKKCIFPTRQKLLEAQAHVACFNLYPSTDVSVLENIIKDRKVVIIELYHCGTASTELIQFIENHSKEITFLVGTFPKKYIDLPYESSQKIQQAGAYLYADLQPYFLYTFSVLSLSLQCSEQSIISTLLPWALKSDLNHKTKGVRIDYIEQGLL